MSANKWLVDFKSVAENFVTASKSFADCTLVGIIYGIENEKKIFNVVFIEALEDTKLLQEKAENILIFLPPEFDALGLARLTSSSLSFYKEEKISLIFTSDDLKSVTKSLRKLTAANPTVVNQQNFIIKSSDYKEIRVTFENNFSTEESLKAQLKDLIKNSTSDSDFTLAINKNLKLTPKFTNNDAFTINKTLTDLQVSSVKLNVDLLVKINSKLSNFDFCVFYDRLMQRIFTQAQIIISLNKDIGELKITTFSPPGLNHVIHLALPVGNETLQNKHRRNVHKLLNLTTSFSIFHEQQSLCTTINHFRLFNPHEYIKYSSFKDGICAIVRGRYEYYHYMQDKFNDNGWGCAYRSFQTVWSWLFHQKFTSKVAPSHSDIQQCLVDIGDKKPNFVSSQEWIGSLELSYCLENMLGISSRILSAKSSDAITEHARAIIFHFENFGAPIMIGGGQYAYTILGIDYDVRLGKCQFLVLDPHYTGSEDVNQILKNGWCAWKQMDFWSKKCFFNLLLPINPNVPKENL